MKALEVFSFITKQVSTLGKGKKVYLNSILEDDSVCKYSMNISQLLSLNFNNNILYLHVSDIENPVTFNTLEIKDGDIENVDHVVSPCKTILNLELYKLDVNKKMDTHTKLLNKYLKNDCLDLFKDKGFVGSKVEFIACLLYALDATSAYTETSCESEDKYFSALIEQMNQVSRHF